MAKAEGPEPTTMSHRLRRSVGAVMRWPRQTAVAVVLLPVVAVRLHRSGFQSTTARLDRPIASGPDCARTAADRVRIARDLSFIVRLGARPIPDATCLRTSLVLRYLLAGEGIPATIRLGARPQDDPDPEADRYGFHAWVEVEGAVVSEPPETIAEYSVLMDDAGP